MSLFTLACLDPCPSPFVVGEASRVQVGSLVLERSVLDAGVCGPAFVTGVDLDLDGRDEAVVSRFGRMRAPSVPNGALVRYDADG